MKKHGKMTDHNLSAVLYNKGDLRLEDRAIPQPGSGEVQIAVSVVGICGSDTHFWQTGRTARYALYKPVLLGHESAGTVTRLGAGVRHLQVGDRVAIEPGVPCSRCAECKTGRYNLCPDSTFLSNPHQDGDLARFHVHDANMCHRLPDSVSFEEGALLEPLSVGVHACRRAGVKLGQTVLVCGAGPVGLLCLMTAKAMGAGHVCVTDISEYRLALARNVGATHTVHVEQGVPGRAVADRVCMELGSSPDVTLECSGAETSIHTAIYATMSGGTVALVGLGKPEASLPLINAVVREVDVKGVFRYANCYPVALSMLISGQIDVRPLVTHRFKLEETLEAFETAASGKDGAVKVMIHCDRDWKRQF